MDKAELEEMLEYRDGVLFWRKAPSHNTSAGDVAGYLDTHGYKKVSLKGVKYYQHHVVLWLHGIETPKGSVVDHINGDRGDNRLENLRVVSHSENTRNAGLRSTNKSGHFGVSWYRPYGKWRVAITCGGKQVSGGYYSEFDDAVRRAAELYKELGFHENHGRAATTYMKGVG